jgi:uncharacterized protein
VAFLESLHVYPVKSCGGIAVEQPLLSATGLQHDREWVLVDPRDHFLTQRDEPRMALLRTALDASHLTFEAPGRDPLRVPLDHQGPLRTATGDPLRVPLDHEGPLRTATVWRSQNPAFDAGDAAAAWLGGFLGREVRLLRFDGNHRRLSNRDWTHEIEAPNFFTDGYPIMVLSRASLDDLNGRLGRELEMNRFRPNIVLGDVAPYAEDRIREIDAGGITLRLVKPCTRCVITTTDQATGARDGDEPLRTLKSYRFDRALRGLTFGMNAVIVRGQGERLQRGQVIGLRWS